MLETAEKLLPREFKDIINKVYQKEILTPN
jgi:hypothetical protein